MIDISLIKQRLSCVEYCRRKGYPINKSGDRCISPLRPTAHNPTSFLCYDEFWIDFGSGDSGDVIDLCAIAEFNGDKGKAIRHLAKLTGVDVPQNFGWQRYTENLNNRIQFWHESLTPADYDYLHKRGLTDDTIHTLRIGRTEDGRLSIPYYKNGYVSYYATRYMDGGANPQAKYMKAPRDDYNDNCIWGLDTISRNNDLLIISEGAFDSISFYQEGYAVISAITGNFSHKQMSDVADICKSFHKVFITYDNDTISHAGEKFTLKMAKFLIQHRIPTVVGFVPRQYKDVSDFYADGGNLANIIAAASPAEEFLAKSITDWQEFQTFCRNATRYYSGADIEVFFNNITPLVAFPTETMKALKSDCKKPVSDMEAADDIVSRHILLYNPKIGFYEYLRNHWVLQTDESIGGYITAFLQNASTGSRISSILRILKSRTVTDELFNQNPIVNFINGTLDLSADTPVFREHSQSDMCTYVLDYPYLPDADCPRWKQFLTEVTDNDDRKQCLLQELAGYILYPQNTLQKCAVLIGAGANGKSVFLDILSAVFGTQNVTAVEMSSMSEPFRVINLMTSMLNISAETRTDVSGAESMFKQIVAGDEISACYKGKDFITFRPRSKMFVSCNEFIKSKDTTEGWTRRFVFISFPIHFVDNPHEPDERKINRNITSELLTELPGVFNWLLSGYNVLRQQGYFTETDDQAALVEEFKETSNPLIEFVKQYAPTDEYISNNKLYADYKLWCDDDGHHPLSRGAFTKRIAPLMKQYRKDAVPKRTMNDRGYAFDHPDLLPM